MCASTDKRLNKILYYNIVFILLPACCPYARPRARRSFNCAYRPVFVENAVEDFAKSGRINFTEKSQLSVIVTQIGFRNMSITL